MICLDDTDLIEGDAEAAAEVDYTIHGIVGSTFTQLAAGQLPNAKGTLHTAGAATSVVCITLVNTGAAAQDVNLYIDPDAGGNSRRLIPEDVSLGIGYSLHFDGQRCTMVDASGNVQTMPGLHAPRHLAGGADPITTMVTSTNVITDHQVLRGDGGVRAAQETTIIVNDNGEMINPSQPAFLAQLTAEESDVTGDGTNWNTYDGVNNWTEVFDQGNNFDGDGTFTAPVTGKYLVTFIAAMQEVGAAHTRLAIRFVASNGTYYVYRVNPAPITATTIMFSCTIIVDMDANDTVFGRINVYNGTKVVDVFTETAFSGSLLC